MSVSLSLKTLQEGLAYIASLEGLSSLEYKRAVISSWQNQKIHDGFVKSEGLGFEVTRTSYGVQILFIDRTVHHQEVEFYR